MYFTVLFQIGGEREINSDYTGVDFLNLAQFWARGGECLRPLCFRICFPRINCVYVHGQSPDAYGVALVFFPEAVEHFLTLLVFSLGDAHVDLVAADGGGGLDFIGG